MNKKLVVLSAVLGLTTLGWSDTKKEDATDRLDNAAKVLHEVMAAPDKGIPDEVLEHAKCVAVVPHMVKGGFVLGAEGGKGWPHAARRTDGALRRSSPWRGEASACRSAWKASIW